MTELEQKTKVRAAVMGTSLRQLCEGTGLSPQTLLARLRTPKPRLDDLRQLAGMLHVGLDRLLAPGCGAMTADWERWL